ncbi:glucosaminidase domain-containing protein [Sporosarcina sp. FSL K6-5500]|uniref:glucosaminidase domain-containing protein n=1 Tax=Sporosarcina sp. FSL K6-5500 TaxID=2921558 RepID=UPI0030F8C2CB
MFLKIHKKLFSILLVSTLIFSMLPSIANAEIAWDMSADQPTNKPWTITFNKPVDRNSVGANTVFVVDAAGNKVKSEVLTDGDKVIILPPNGGYTPSTTYSLHVTNGVRNSDDTPLKESVIKKFSIVEADPTYDTATLRSDGSTTISKSFATYNEAIAALTVGQVILYDDAIIKMDSGIVVTKPTVDSVLTIIYSDQNFRNEATYVIDDTELEYVESTDRYVKVKVAGNLGFIKHANGTLLPWTTVKDKRSYYSTRNGILTHSIYSNKTGTFSSYQAGNTPSFMNDGERYYSWDGSHFFDSNGTQVGTGYQYFQFLPARSKTNYTAEEIDAYILTTLKSLEADYPNDPTYRNAAEKSKLIGLGAFLKQVEEEQQINALLILALAQHESTYGLSKRAQQFNNLFGLKVYDDRPVPEYFETVEENILELVNAYLNKNYIPPNNAYAYGAIFGNKAVGFNVKYAADPYWGAKAAGHMYRIDKLMGGKDLANPYTIGLTTEALNVRSGPGTNNSLAYRYAKTGIPVIIIEPVKPLPWLKVISDAVGYDELFVHGDYVKEITIVK